MTTQSEKIVLLLSDDSNQSDDLSSVDSTSKAQLPQGSESTAGKFLLKANKISDKTVKEILASGEIDTIYKPSQCIKYMHIEFHPSLFKLWFAADIYRELSQTEVTLDLTTDLFDIGIILWKRSIPIKFFSEDGQERISEIKQLCHRALCVKAADSIEEFVHQNTLAKEIGKIRALVDSHLTLVIFGTNDYFEKPKRKTKNSERQLMSKIELEMAITDLLVTAGCDTILVDSPNELALHIVQFTKAVAEEPFKRWKGIKNEKIDFYMQGQKKDCLALFENGDGMTRVWKQMISSLPSSSLDIARTFCAQYKTPKSFYSACKPLNCEKSIANLEVNRSGVPGAKMRRLGPELARKLRILFTSTDGDEIVE